MSARRALFVQWTEKVQRERAGGRRGRIWMEVQNYYVQRFSGYRWKGVGPPWPDGRSTRDPSAPNWPQLYARALEVTKIKPTPTFLNKKGVGC